jgi:hypothetical protein
MKTYFDGLQPIEKSEFLTKFDEHIKKRPKIDSTEKQIFQTLQDSASLSYYLGTLNEKGIENLILPHHAVELEPGRDPDRPVKLGGDQFYNVIRNYIENYIPNSRFPKGTKKLLEQKSRFFNDNSILKADFLFVCNQKEYAHPENHYDDSHGQNKIYIGNGFHRFVAYGLWISQNGFKPLELYYVEQPI